MSELTRDVKLLIENHFPPVWVEGEISNFVRHSSGHLYFSLKDAEAQMSCVMWRGRNQSLVFRPEDGMKITAMGNLTVYERQGRYQLEVMLMQPAGIGDLQMAFEALKKRLQEEGLFESTHKKPLPVFPKMVGVVTSPTGAAIRDIVSVIRRRFPAVEIVLRPARVQGEGAAEDIAAAIRELNAFGQPDVLIVGRGGGSLEDLWAFNEEKTVRAIFESRIPVVSAVGHEIDFTISDFVADVRAPTPSAAAELVVRDREELHETVWYYARRLYQQVRNRIVTGQQRLHQVQRRYAFRIPGDRIRESRLMLDDTLKTMERSALHRIMQDRLGLARARARLEALDPDAVLNRGYSLTTRDRDGALVTRAEQVSAGEKLNIRLARGKIITIVEDVEE